MEGAQNLTLDLTTDFEENLDLSDEKLQSPIYSYQIKKEMDFLDKSRSVERPEISLEMQKMCESLKKCVEIRKKYMSISFQTENPIDKPGFKKYPIPPLASIGISSSTFSVNVDMESFSPKKNEFNFEMSFDGIFMVYESQEAFKSNTPFFKVPSIAEYYKDLDSVLDIISDGPLKSFAFKRMRFLEARFQLYTLLNESSETAATKKVPHRDFYNCRKVDTHVHHSSCMNQKHLLRFIKSKLKKCPNDVVIYRDKKYLTLQQVFDSLHLTAYDLSIDTLDMHAHADSFHRFDKFNLKYNPMGESRLREIFLKTDNLIQGKYLAELTKEVISDLEASKYQLAEYRISIYGRSVHEWDKLAAWICNHGLFSDNVRWLIQIPRLYHVYKDSNIIENFEEFIRNIFKPLFEVTRDPNSHPQLHIFLQYVVGFDSVDDESKAERRIHKKFPVPKLWDSILNPPYTYYLYYMYANLTSLNQWRKSQGQSI